MPARHILLIIVYYMASDEIVQLKSELLCLLKSRLHQRMRDPFAIAGFLVNSFEGKVIIISPSRETKISI